MPNTFTMVDEPSQDYYVCICGGGSSGNHSDNCKEMTKSIMEFGEALKKIKIKGVPSTATLALAAIKEDAVRKVRDCSCCIINDMSAACRPGDESCHLFHRRLAGLLSVPPVLDKRRQELDAIDQAGQCEFCAFGPHKCIRENELSGTTGDCWREK